ncbi:uncharacterized protein LOC124280276 [Haliotis rubra]|uniref:uncharacterized protein LOC124280276 n=1 Tax=Haliotis rubra TaxID=36100 RepID=UPI001EE621D2|nr:uncharacterized protein LOC124280276 [Haliotis rubra]
MSFRQALRSRFKGDVKAEEDGGTLVRKGSGKRPKTLVDHKDGEETFEVLHSDKEEDGMSFQSASSHSPQGSEASDIVAGFKDAEERAVFESQLTQLQEQLVAVMIENQTLQTELRDYREKSSVDKLRQELEYQKHRNEMLEEKCFSLDKKSESMIIRESPTTESMIIRESTTESMIIPPESMIIRESPTTESMIIRESPTTESMIIRESPTTESMIIRESPTTESMIIRESPTTESMIIRESPTTESMIIRDHLVNLLPRSP